MEASTLMLNDGNQMPVVGLGTFQGSYDYKCHYDSALASVKHAIDIGYRHIDTALTYNTEKVVGDAVREKIAEGVVTRQDMFIATKLWCTHHRRDQVVPALKQSLDYLGLDYVDIFMIHWPMAMKPSDDHFPKDDQGNIAFEDNITDFIQTWQGMEECKELKLAKSIGVSNFNPKQLQKIIDLCRIRPAVNEFECHPFNTNNKWVDYCTSQGVAVTCYSPLGKPARPWAQETDPVVFTNETICDIAKTHGKTPAQVALRFQIQRNLAVIPKSSNPERQKENLNIFDFELSEKDMQRLHKLDRKFRVLPMEHFSGSIEYPFRDD